MITQSEGKVNFVDEWGDLYGLGKVENHLTRTIITQEDDGGLHVTVYTDDGRGNGLPIFTFKLC